MKIVRNIKGRALTFLIRQRKRQKRFIIRASAPDVFTVTAPKNAAVSMIKDVIDEHKDAISVMEAPIDYIREMARLGNPIVFGAPRRVSFQPFETGEALGTDTVLRVSGNTPKHREAALKKHLAAVLETAVAHVKNDLLARFENGAHDGVQIRLRTMKSRFGSCNAQTKRITLNKELVHYPWACLVYVCAHEIAHLKHPDHSQRFKETLTKLLPSYQAIDRRMKTLRGLLLTGRFDEFVAESAATHNPR